MPKFNKVSDDKIIEKNQQTTTGLFVSAGEIQAGENDTKDWNDLQVDYQNMRNGSGIISTTLEAVTYPILASDWILETKMRTELAEKAKDYVEWTFNNLDFFTFLRHQLLAVPYGLQIHEKIWKQGANYQNKPVNQLIKLAPIMNETIYKFLYDDYKGFIGIQHERREVDSGSSFIDIDSSKLHYISYNHEFGDIRGRSALRPIRLSWESKLKLLKSKVIATQRGAGIPLIGVQGNLSESSQALVKKLGRTIAQMSNGYAVYDMQSMKIDLIEPKSNADVVPMLEYLNREIFYNLLVEFLAAGLGQNGSRAATGEHKAPYEMTVNYIQSWLERNINVLIRDIILNSHLAKISEAELPLFKFDNPKSQDMKKVAETLNLMTQSGLIQKAPGDEEFFRKSFGFPLPETVEPVTLSSKCLAKKTKRELTKLENEVFQLDSANEHFLTTQEKVENELSKYLNKILTDIADQLKYNHKKDIEVRFFRELNNKLQTLYSQGYNRGSRDINIELSKKTTKLAIVDRKSKKIERRLKTLFSIIKNTVETKLDNMSAEAIKKKGGISKYVMGFETQFRMPQRNVITSVQSGYTDGRGEEMLKSDAQLFTYTAILDQNLCDQCAPLDGAKMTREEVIEAGLNFVHPVNPDCDGDDKCRCQLIPE